MNDTDYIMRMVEQFARFLGRILFHKKAEETHAAADLVAEALANLLGLDAALVDSLPLRDLVDQLSDGGGLDADKCIVLAVLMAESADLLAGKHETERAERRRLMALDLLLIAHNADRPVTIPEHFKRIEALRAALSDRYLPEPTVVELIAFYERTGRFARAEDELFDRLASGDDSSVLLDAGTAFYRRLLDADDERLTRGNLPRAEVEEGLSELEQMRGE